MKLTGVFLSAVVLLGVIINVVNSCPPSDREALLALKSGLTEPYLGILNTWTGTDCCTNWYGISCDPTDNRVNDIILRGESEDKILQKTGRSGYMTGSLSPSLCSLDRLTTLIVADWKAISGEIPACITTLPHLRILDLIGNQLTGPLPSDIGKLSKLTVLNVAYNKLSGQIPPSIVNLKSLMHLDLSNNQLTGPLPSDFGSLSMMSRALLNRNQLTGSIPVSLAGIYRLADLDLSMNKISGSIPAQFGSMPVLSTLNLDSNQLSGSIPVTLLSNSGLNILNLSRNALEGNLPDVFTARTYFTVLDLSYNKLKGSIPKSLSSAKFIGHLDLSNNHLCGEIPVGVPFDHLEATSFSNNDCLCGLPLMHVC
uniref:DNA damage-repair/toleration protein DRT100-like n=1 Tax=Erigeron canadensis TaxID=72917 RepID=UPI001CB90B68|nr:DNA damage-repair/toleration protein DRT100-like [Erigeron canadensis]